MWVYEKKLQFPVNISRPDPKLAKAIITQIGGPDGEMAAAMRYLHQRYTMPLREVRAILTDIGTEELAHLEMIGAIVYQLTRNLSVEQIREAGFDQYFVDHTTGVYPQGASGTAFSASVLQSKGDPIADLMENLAAEQKARATYDNILRLTDDPEVRKPIEFLRAREIVHFQRFGEALRLLQRHLNSCNYYQSNASFDHVRGIEIERNTCCVNGRNCDRDCACRSGHDRECCQRNNNCGCESNHNCCQQNRSCGCESNDNYYENANEYANEYTCNQGCCERSHDCCERDRDCDCENNIL